MSARELLTKEELEKRRQALHRGIRKEASEQGVLPDNAILDVDEVFDMALASLEPVAMPEVGRKHFAIIFDDYDRRPEIFAGEGAEAAARHRYQQISASWNAHFFVRAHSNTLDARLQYGDGAARGELSGWISTDDRLPPGTGNYGDTISQEVAIKARLHFPTGEWCHLSDDWKPLDAPPALGESKP